ncbi:MAG: hypothetical protein QXJ28_03225 [Candidatus Pacearchaeota archaeon]
MKRNLDSYDLMEFKTLNNNYYSLKDYYSKRVNYHINRIINSQDIHGFNKEMDNMTCWLSGFLNYLLREEIRIEENIPCFITNEDLRDLGMRILEIRKQKEGLLD